MELHVLQYYKTPKGIYTSIDEAEIRKVIGGGGYTFETIDSSINIKQDSLACYEDNGEFYIQNENCDRVCDIKLLVDDANDIFSYCTIDSTSSIDIELSEEYYNVTINNKHIDEINLTDELKRDIDNMVNTFISRTNEENN